MAETNVESLPVSQRKPRIKRVQIKSDVHEVLKDPNFTDCLRGSPSQFYSYYLNFFKPGKFDKQSYKTNNILKKFTKEKLYDESKDPQSFFEIVEEYNGQYMVSAKPFLIDVETWKTFAEPNSLSEIRRMAEISLEKYKKSNSSRKSVQGNLEGLHFETKYDALEIVVSISTKLLQRSLQVREQEGNLLMVELHYKFESDGKSGGLPKVRLPLDLFLAYLEKHSTQFIEICSSARPAASPETGVKDENTTKKRKRNTNTSASEVKKRKLSSDSSTNSE